MGFFGNLFKKKISESVVLIDVGAGSVAGAYAVYKKDEVPTIIYASRLIIDIRSGEPHEASMLRALTMLCRSLVSEGAPVLRRASGSGRVDTILVSIDSPWQETSVRTEHFEKKEEFVFTETMLRRAMEQTRISHDKKIIVDESIIGTILNGYETDNPYGKKVHRASVIILTSIIEKNVAGQITEIIRGAYHANHVLSITDSSLRYQALENLFPHERDMLILDATGFVTSIALIRKGLFVDIVEVPTASDSHEWVEKVTGELSEIAGQYPLPRTIFLLAQGTEAVELQNKLSAAKLNALWLSDNPPAIVAVLPSHLNEFIRQTATTTPDLPLLLMALYYQHTTFK